MDQEPGSFRLDNSSSGTITTMKKEKEPTQLEAVLKITEEQTRRLLALNSRLETLKEKLTSITHDLKSDICVQERVEPNSLIDKLSDRLDTYNLALNHYGSLLHDLESAI